MQGWKAASRQPCLAHHCLSGETSTKTKINLRVWMRRMGEASTAPCEAQDCWTSWYLIFQAFENSLVEILHADSRQTNKELVEARSANGHDQWHGRCLNPQYSLSGNSKLVHSMRTRSRTSAMLAKQYAWISKTELGRKLDGPGVYIGRVGNHPSISVLRPEGEEVVVEISRFLGTARYICCTMLPWSFHRTVVLCNIFSRGSGSEMAFVFSGALQSCTGCG